MTLFRKVFQNQARPATQAETPDEDDLHSAFEAAQEAEETPLALDPFAVADPAAAAYEGHEPVDHELDLTALGRVLNPTPESEADQEGAADDIDNLSLDNLEFHGDSFQGVEPDTLEDAAPVWQAPAPEADAGDDLDGEGDDVDMHADDDAVEHDISDLIERAQETAMQPDCEEMNEVSDSESDFVERRSEDGEVVKTDGELASPAAEVSAPEKPKTDLAAFAREQMAAVEGLNTQPTEQDDKSRAAREAKTLDLSTVNVMGAASAPAAGRAGRRAGRVKTRLLGFNRAGDDANDPIGEAVEATAAPQHEKFPVGWLVVVEGPGIGHSFSIFTGASMIGRGDDQMIKLDFGDNSISRQNHAAIAYDEEQNKFYIGHGGKSNIIRRNARPVLSTEELHHADLIRIGETTLRFVALCGSDFKWDITDVDDAAAV